MVYFKHDVNASEDDKICELLASGGYELLGYYWRFIEYLYNRGGSLPEDKLPSVAWNLRMDIGKLKTLINDFGLFDTNKGIIYSKRVVSELKAYEEIKKQMSELGKKGGKASAKARNEAHGEPNGQPNAQPNGEPTAQPHAQADGQPHAQADGQPHASKNQPYGQAHAQAHGQAYGQADAQPIILDNIIPDNIIQNNIKEKSVSKKESAPRPSYKEIVSGYEFSEDTRKLIGCFLQLRMMKKNAPTNKALTMICNKLAKENEATQKMMLKKTIENGWQTVYPLIEKEVEITNSSFDEDEFIRLALSTAFD